MTWLIVALLGLLAMSASAKAPQPEPSSEDDEMSPKKRLYAMLRALPMLTEDQRLFVMLVAFGETGGTYKASAHNDTPSEVAASRKAMDNEDLTRRLLGCNAGGVDEWAIGSGGFGGRLVPYFGDDMLDVGLPCSPRGVFDPVLSLVSTILVAWKLQQTKGWARSAKTVANLRVGYYGLAYIDDVPPERREKYIRHAEEVHLPDGFVDVVLTEFPGPEMSRQIFSALASRPA